MKTDFKLTKQQKKTISKVGKEWKYDQLIGNFKQVILMQNDIIEDLQDDVKHWVYEFRLLTFGMLLIFGVLMYVIWNLGGFI